MTTGVSFIMCCVGEQKGSWTNMFNIAIDLGNPYEHVKVDVPHATLHYLESGVAKMTVTLTVKDAVRLRDWLITAIPTTCLSVIEEGRKNMGLTVSEYCRRFCFQNCANCEDYGCGDNTNTRN